MIPIIIATISIFIITGVFWLFNKFSPIQVCPICAGVSGTWLLILAGLFLGILIHGGWVLIVAMGMGGSVVGIAYQLEKKMPKYKSTLLWKTLFIPIGFIAVYSLFVTQWIIFVISIIFMIILAWLFTRKKISHPEKEKEVISKLENKMKDCC